MKMKLPATISATTHIGVSVGTHFVAAVSVDINGTPLTATEYRSEVPLIYRSQIVDVQVVAALKQLKGANSWPANLAAVSIPEKLAFTRTHHLPQMKRIEIDEAVNWQTPQLFPYDPNEIYTDWRLLSSSNQEILVAVTAVPSKVIDSLKNCCHAVGLYPISFEPSVSLLSRLVPAQNNALVGVVELDESGMSMTIVRGGVVEVTGTAFFNQKATLEQRLQISAQTITELCTHFVRENKISDTIPLLLTGEVDLQPFLSPLSQRLKSPVTELSVNKITNQFHTAYAAAVSAALPPESEKSINILPHGLRQFYDAANVYEITTKILRGISVILGLGLIAAFSFYLMIFAVTNQKLAALEKLTTQQTATDQEVDLNTLTRNAVRYKRLFEKKASPEYMITSLLEVLPAETKLTSVTIDPVKKTIRLSGIAPDREAVLRIHQTLMDSELFTGGDIPLSALSTSATGDFTFDVGVKKNL